MRLRIGRPCRNHNKGTIRCRLWLFIAEGPSVITGTICPLFSGPSMIVYGPSGLSATATGLLCALRLFHRILLLYGTDSICLRFLSESVYDAVRRLEQQFCRSEFFPVAGAGSTTDGSFSIPRLRMTMTRRGYSLRSFHRRTIQGPDVAYHIAFSVADVFHQRQKLFHFPVDEVFGGWHTGSSVLSVPCPACVRRR